MSFGGPTFNPLVILVPLPFYTNIKIILSIYKNILLEALIGTALNLYVNLEELPPFCVASSNQ